MFIDPTGLFAVRANQVRSATRNVAHTGASAAAEIGQGMVTGVVDYGRSTVAFAGEFISDPWGTTAEVAQSVVTNRIDAFVTNPIDAVIFAPGLPQTYIRGMYRGFQSDGWYGVGRVYGQNNLGPALTVGAGAAIGAGATVIKSHLPKTARVTQLRANPLDDFSNPRIGPSETAMTHHKNYIRTHGGIESPIDVRALPNGNFEIINGHHRWQAALQTGLDRVPIKIHYY